jgi:hypothetical protein
VVLYGCETFDIKGGTWTAGIRELGAEDNIWNEGGRIDRTLEKLHNESFITCTLAKYN